MPAPTYREPLLQLHVVTRPASRRRASSAVTTASMSEASLDTRGPSDGGTGTGTADASRRDEVLYVPPGEVALQLLRELHEHDDDEHEDGRYDEYSDESRYASDAESEDSEAEARVEENYGVESEEEDEEEESAYGALVEKDATQALLALTSLRSAPDQAYMLLYTHELRKAMMTSPDVFTGGLHPTAAAMTMGAVVFAERYLFNRLRQQIDLRDEDFDPCCDKCLELTVEVINCLERKADLVLARKAEEEDGQTSGGITRSCHTRVARELMRLMEIRSGYDWAEDLRRVVVEFVGAQGARVTEATF